MKHTILATNGVEFGKRKHRLVELTLISFEGYKEKERLNSFINPDKPLPVQFESNLEIPNKLLAQAPVFCDVANDILAILEDSIIIGENINANLSLLRKEFNRIGYNFKGERICLSKLTKKSKLRIESSGALRTEDKASESIEMWEILQSTSREPFDSASNRQPFQSLPEQINREDILQLPNRAGVYYFRNNQGTVVYVGKAKAIRKRVMSHFNSKLMKEKNLAAETFDLDFEETGCELIALLLESSEIAKFLPKYNSAQIIPSKPYQIVTRLDTKGILRLYPERKTYEDSAISYYSNRKSVIFELERLCREYRLCPKYTGLQRTKLGCNYKQIQCSGVCRGEENRTDYNIRAQTAYDSLDNRKSFAIIEKGRKATESSFVLIRKGFYHGFGFVDHSFAVQSLEHLEPYLIHGKSSYHTNQIISSQLSRKKKCEMVYD